MGQPKKLKNRKTKSVLVFDEEARLDWLTGFRKRKNERRKKATEDLQKQLKDELKRKKQEHRDKVKKSQQKYLDRLVEAERIVEAKSYRLASSGTAEVTVTEIDTLQSDALLGTNVVAQEVVEKDDSDVNEDGSDRENHGSDRKKRTAARAGTAVRNKRNQKPSKKATTLQARLLKLNQPRYHRRRRRQAAADGDQ